MDFLTSPLKLNTVGSCLKSCSDRKRIMPSFSNVSMAALSTCHPILRRTAEAAIDLWDFRVLYGWRDEETQNNFYYEGLSKVRWPNSKHNNLSTQEDVDLGWCQWTGIPLSLAFDIAPWHPTGKHIRWKNEHDFYLLAGLIIGIGQKVLGVSKYKFRYGGDWNMNLDTYDQSFMDLCHIELVER